MLFIQSNTLALSLDEAVNVSPDSMRFGARGLRRSSALRVNLFLLLVPEGGDAALVEAAFGV